MNTRKKIAYKCYSSFYEAKIQTFPPPLTEWFIKDNQEFLDREIKEIREKQFDRVIITSLSNSQDHETDYLVAQQYPMRSSMVAFLIIQAYFQAQLGNSVIVEIDLFLTADIFGQLPAGQSYKSMLQCYFPQPQTKVESKQAEVKHAVNIVERQKTSLSYVRIQRAACFFSKADITIFFYDDSSVILKHFYETYSKNQHPFIFRNTTLILRQYPIMAGPDSFQEHSIVGESHFLDTRYDKSLVYMCAHLQRPKFSHDTSHVALDWNMKSAPELKSFYEQKRYYNANRRALMDDFRECNDGRGKLDNFDLMRRDVITQLTSAKEITEITTFTTARDLLDELNIPLVDVLGEELAAQLPPPEKKISLDEFFNCYELDAKGYLKKSSLKSDLQKMQAEITVEDIIYHAMKNPVNEDGTEGNRTARILYYTFKLDVADPVLRYTRPDNPAHHQLAKQFYDACKIIRDKEKIIVEKFKTRYKSATSNQYGARVKEKKYHRHYGLVWYLTHAKSNWYNKLLGTVGIYGFYSGKRSYTLFKNQFNMDARQDSPTEEMAQKMVAVKNK